MNRFRFAALCLCAAEALLSSPVTFTSGTLLWGSKDALKVYDVTQGGDLSGAPLAAAGTGSQSGQMTFSLDRSVGYMTSSTKRYVFKVTPDSSTAAYHATLPAAAYGVLVTPDGKVYVSCADGKIYDATAGGVLTAAKVVASGLSGPRNMLWTPDGILVVEQTPGKVTKLGYLGGNTGPAQTFATNVFGAADIELFNGRIYVSSLSSSAIYDITSGVPTEYASGQGFIGLASANGKLYAATYDSNPRIYEVTGGGVITNASLFGYNLPGNGESMFDSVPGSIAPDPTPISDTPELSTFMMFGTGLLVAGSRRRVS